MPNISASVFTHPYKMEPPHPETSSYATDEYDKNSIAS